MRKFPISRRFLFALAFLPVVSLAVACQPADEQDGGTAEDTMAMEGADVSGAMDELAAAYVQHYNLGHADMVAALYTDSAIALLADGTVARGRAEIQQVTAAQLAAGSPKLSISISDTKAGGDTAVAIGSWSVTATPEGGEPVKTSGHWMGAYQHGADGWKIMGVITNYDSEQPAEAYMGKAPVQLPPENSRMGALIDAYANAWNAGDAAGIAALYAPDAWAAFVNSPVSEGRDAIRQAMEQRVRGAIEIHGVRTVSLGGGWNVDGGWWQVAGGEGPTIRGNYWLVAHGEAGATPVIQWAVSNGRVMAEGQMAAGN